MPELEIDLPLLGFIVAAVLLAGVTFVLLRRRTTTTRGELEDRSINVAALKVPPPPPTGAQLEFYGTSVRVAVLVLAPAGRGGDSPTKQELPKIAEHLLPGLMEVLKAHQPIFRLWPAQLSSTGFAHSFFNNMKLPGERGKDTRWCSVVGKFSVRGRPFLAGLVCASELPNGLSEVTVEHEGRWLDVLRVRSAADVR